MNGEEQQLEQAVLLCVNPNSDQNLKKQALVYLDGIKASPDSWKHFLRYFLQKVDGPNEVKFFALQVIEDLLRNNISSLSEGDKTLLKATFMSWIRDESSKRLSEPQFLRKKFAQLVVLLFSQEYLRSWPTFFEELLSFLPRGASVVEMFLRICIAIDEEIIAREYIRSDAEFSLATQIKDEMRLKSINLIVDAWYTILETYYKTSPDIVNLCLSAISLYVGWIDINLVATEKFINAFYSFLGNEKHQNSACECVNGIILKKMKADKKISLIHALNLNQILDRIPIEDVSETVAKLINDVGVTLCACWSELDPATESQLQEFSYKLIESILPYFYRLLGHEDEDLSASVFEFSQSLLGIFKQEKKIRGNLSDSKRKALQTLLSVVVMKMKYGPSYNFYQEGEFETNFQEARKKLKIQFDNIATIDEEMLSDYVVSALEITLRNLDKCHFTDAELVLRLLYMYADAIKGQIRFSKTDKNNDPILTKMVQIMMESKVSCFPHHYVQIEYFENLIRYSRFFEVYPEYLDEALLSLIDQRGLHNVESEVRNRVMYLFLKFVKNLKMKLVSNVPSILANIEDLLSLPNTNLTIVRPSKRRLSQNSMSNEFLDKFNDQLNLFEATGVLVSIEQIPESERIVYLRGLITPLVVRIDEIMEKQYYKLDTDDNPIYRTILHHAITATGSIAKGFPNHPGKLSNWEVIFREALTRAIFVLQTLPNVSILKDAVRFLFQRLVGAIGSEVISFLPTVSTLLLSNSTIKDIIDFIPFVSQLTYRFQDSIYPILNELLGIFLLQVFPFLDQQPKILNETTGITVNSYESLQQIDVRRAYTNFVLTIFTSGLGKVFTSERNIQQLDNVLKTISMFAIDDDVQLQKISIGVFQKMVETWGTINQENGNLTIPGFDQFALQNIMPLCFQIPLKPNFNLNDGVTYVILGEICTLKKLIFTKFGGEVIAFLQGVYLPSIGFPPQVIQEYLTAFQTLDQKSFQRYYKNLIQKMKTVS